MTELLNVADRLRNKANAAKDKSGTQVKSETILSAVVSFLNDDNMSYTAVETIFPPNKPKSQIVQRFRQIIKEQNLDELVWPIEDGDHVYLTMLVDRDTTENDS